MEEQIDRAEELARRLEVIERLSAKMGDMRRKFVLGRKQTGVEERWYEALRLYYGHDLPAHETIIDTVSRKDGPTPPVAVPRSRVTVNIVGPKTDSAIARVQDLLFPVDEANWSLKPTPVPKLASMLKDNRPVLDDSGNPMINQATGQPLRVADVAEKIRQQANDACKLMEREIADQLVECHYNAEGRRCIFFAGLFGTGIMKGPVAVNRVSRAWLPVESPSGARWIKHSVSDLRPASFAVDPRFFYPDPTCGNDIQKGCGVFEKSYVSKKQLRDLRREPGYIKHNIDLVLSQRPIHTPLSTPSLEGDRMYSIESDGDVYEMWEFYGEFTVKELRAAGLGDPDPETGMSLISPDADDNDALHGVCIMVNDIVIKMFLNPDPGGAYPYDVFNWKRDEDTIWGYGIPDQMRSQQLVIKHAWRIAMDSQTLTAGPQIIVRRDLIRPADGKWYLTPRKFWFANETLDDVRKAFTIVEVNSRLNEQIAMIEAATKLADQETALPMMLQGERGSAPDTVGGMTILMNNANVGVKRIVKQFDDQITVPHITRYYDWNMMYSDKQEIKGDFQVDARGSSSLVVKDMRNQAAMQFAVTFGTHPRFGIWIDEEKLIKLTAEAVSLADVIRPAEDVMQERQNMQAQEDPRVTVAKIQQQTAQMVAEIRRDSEIEKVSRMVALKLEELGVLSEQQSEKIKAEIAKVIITEKSREGLMAAELATKAAFGSGI